jgi:fused signal recognition particle receptor
MPEGITTELVIVGVLVLLVIAAVVLPRFVRPPTKPPELEEGAEAPPIVTEEPHAEPAPVVEEAPPTVVVEEAPVEAPPRPTLRDRLAKSRKLLVGRLAEAFGGGVDEDTWDDVEAILIQADVGVETASRITDDLREKARMAKVNDATGVQALLAEELVELFDEDRDRALQFAPDRPTVWLVVGVNGTGKTTTIGKLARDLRERGKDVSLAAADTFRAAADEQLAVWAERSGADLVKHQPGADPGAVAYDAYQHARARQKDVLIVDTAGRLHTKSPLMDELGKIRRVIEKEGHVTETLLVIDATAGQNGLVQAREFTEAAGVTGVVLTKLDGTAKGGIALAIERELGLPIKLIGVGEGIDDIQPFEPKPFVDALIS